MDTTYVGQNEIASACKRFAKAIGISPKSCEAKLGKATTLHLSEHYSVAFPELESLAQETIEIYETVFSIDPRNPLTLNNLANLLAENGQLN